LPWLASVAIVGAGKETALAVVTAIGAATATLYLLYFLNDAVGLADPDVGVFIVIAVKSVVVAVSAVVVGRWPDRVGAPEGVRRLGGRPHGRRGRAAGLLADVAGRPRRRRRAGRRLRRVPGRRPGDRHRGLSDEAGFAKDLGVINIANALAQMIAPVIAAPIVTLLGGYTTLYVTAAIIGLVGAVAVVRIRGVS
jgi:MFS family permease